MRATMLMSVLLVLLASCEARFDWPWLKDKPAEPADGGRSVLEDRTVAAFDQVRLEGLGKLVFDASIPPGTVRVKADQRLLPRIVTSVTGSTLVVKEDGLQGPDAFGLEFRLAAPTGLARVTLAGVGSIEAEQPLVCQELSLVLEGLGKIELAVTAGSVFVRQQGQGELVVRGTADTVTVRTDGLGRVEASELVAKEADVESNGLGEVTVHATQKLKVRANGLGSVRFRGHPAVTDVQTAGLTQVSAID